MMEKDNFNFFLVGFISSVWILIGFASPISAYDINGDGREGLAETIHSLQVSAGLSPSSSSIVSVNPVGTPMENKGVKSLLDPLKLTLNFIYSIA